MFAYVSNGSMQNEINIFKENKTLMKFKNKFVHEIWTMFKHEDGKCSLNDQHKQPVKKAKLGNRTGFFGQFNKYD